jgi:hypothetical protein
MNEEKPVEWILTVSLEDGDAESTDILTRQLVEELREQNIESADLLKGETAPSGTKSADPVTIGAIVVAVLPGFITKLVEFVQAWTLRGYGRTVKFKGSLSGRQVEFEGSSEDFKNLISSLSNKPVTVSSKANKKRESLPTGEKKLEVAKPSKDTTPNLGEK